MLILRAQAQMLSKTTDGLIRGRVDIEDDGMLLKFSVYVPTLNN